MFHIFKTFPPENPSGCGTGRSGQIAVLRSAILRSLDVNLLDFVSNYLISSLRIETPDCLSGKTTGISPSGVIHNHQEAGPSEISAACQLRCISISSALQKSQFEQDDSAPPVHGCLRLRLAGQEQGRDGSDLGGGL